ncbi:hypothetical protein P4O66_005245 [Electrophorus voltai]|uniref:Uncharacterized protein n=1 Tax=Electrophorus voltai TaxID=2609070 RepID=A0AAD8ZWP1_9TELE|nr:hypothetical protein P4O66_005245 [Electrophorus voltai]
MGCSSSTTQAVAQENRPSAKLEETAYVASNGSVAAYAETIADQMQLPVQSALPEGLGPRPGDSQAPVARKALRNVGLEREQAADGSEPTVGSDLIQTAEVAVNIAPEMPADTAESLTPQEDSIFVEGVTAKEAFGASPAVKEVDPSEAASPANVSGLSKCVAAFPVPAATSGPEEELVGCGTLADAAAMEAAFEEASLSLELTPAVEPATTAGLAPTPEPTPAPTLRDTSAAALVPASKPSLVPESSPAMEPSPAPEPVQMEAAAAAVAARAVLQAMQEHASLAGTSMDADTQALEAPGGTNEMFEYLD